MKIKYTCYPFQSTGRPISHWNGWSFGIYIIPLWDFVPEWHSRPGTRTGVHSCWGDSCQHDILWWYHVNKYRAMRGNRSELLRHESRAGVMKAPLSSFEVTWYDQHHNLNIFITLNIIYLATCQDMVPSTLPIQLEETWSMTSWVSQQLKDLYMRKQKKNGAMWFDHNIIFKLINYYIHLKISSYICENNLFN